MLTSAILPPSGHLHLRQTGWRLGSREEAAINTNDCQGIYLSLFPQSQRKSRNLMVSTVSSQPGTRRGGNTRL